MKRLLKSWVFWAFVVPVLMAGAWFLKRREVGELRCSCGSERTESYVRLAGGLILFLRESERVSAIYQDHLQGTHRHDWWVVETDTPRPGKGFRGEKGPSVSYAAHLYQTEPAFGSWLTREVRAGRLSASALDVEIRKARPFPPGRFPFGWTPP